MTYFPSYDTSGATQVTLFAYNARGEPFGTINAAGRETRTVYDDSGRTIGTIQNYKVDNLGQLVMDPDSNLMSASAYHVTEQIGTSATLTPTAAAAPTRPSAECGIRRATSSRFPRRWRPPPARP